MDYGDWYTNETERRVRDRLKSVYREASKDIDDKMEDFYKRYRKKEAMYAKQVKDGKISKEDFDDWKKGQVFQGKQWKNKKDQILDTIYHANTVAAGIINDNVKGVFAANGNYMAYSIENGVNVNFGFGLYDERTVARLLEEDRKLLPEWKIDEPKDYVWNNRKVNRQITQGIIQGESLDAVSKRLSSSLIAQNENSMKTFARTAMTGAQNAGRVTRLKDAQGLGISVNKEWLCTLDGRTRDAHRHFDGMSMPIDKPFKYDDMSIMYPGDPEADASLVYNCRCTLVADVLDYPNGYERRDNIDGKPIKNMSYREWREAKNSNKPVITRQHVDMTLKENYTISKLDWVMQDTGVSKEEAEKMLSSIRTFTSSEYDWVVEHPDSEQYKNMYNGVESYIEKAPKWGGSTIERGIRMTDVDIDQLKVGQTITQQNRVSSWTTDKNLAKKAATNKLKSNESGVIFHMQPPKNGYINGVSVAHVSKKPQEEEVIVSGKSLQVIKLITEEQITKNKRIVHVYVMETR